MSQRTNQVEEVLRNNLNAIFLRELEHPRGVLVTISRVDVSPDLKNARVFVSVLPQTSEKKVLNTLKHNIKTFRYHLGKVLMQRVVPSLFFEIDHGSQHASRIDEIIDKMQKSA